MILQEILDTVMEKYPHALTNDTVIDKINTIQRELFRGLYQPETTHQYDIIAGNPFYSLSFSPEKIIGTVVDGKSYPRANMRYGLIAPCFYVMENNTLVLVPTPTTNIPAGLMVFHYADPLQLSTSDLGNEPDFDRDWHSIIVYRVCKELADAANDYESANGFIGQVNGLVEEYQRSKRYQPIAIQNVFGGLL